MTRFENPIPELRKDLRNMRWARWAAQVCAGLTLLQALPWCLGRPLPLQGSGILFTAAGVVLSLPLWGLGAWRLWARLRRLDQRLGAGSGKAFLEAARLEGHAGLVQGRLESLKAWEETSNSM